MELPATSDSGHGVIDRVEEPSALDELNMVSPSASGHGIIERYRPGKYSHGDPDTGTCPHCWTVFPLEDALFVSRHPDLLGDPLLGPEVAQRFKASRFTPDGQAIDPGGMPSSGMACPACHLEVPRSLVDLKPIFLSIVGAPASGKSYYLGTLTWELRRTLAQDFGFSLTDADSSMNRQLHEYEETLFFPSDPTSFVSLRKTEIQGELYNQVNFNGQVTRFPKPFLFNLKPLESNPASKRGGRSIVLYDNAGEHFLPGADSSLAPTTHLARAKYLLFIFDPTKDPRFRSLVRSKDPQVQPGARLQRQDVILNEAANRIRRYLGIRQDQRVDKRLILVVSKMDVWADLLNTSLKKGYKTPGITPCVPWTLDTSRASHSCCVNCFKGLARRLLRSPRTSRRTSSISQSAPWDAVLPRLATAWRFGQKTFGPSGSIFRSSML
jgi:hypothetical protein